MAKINQGPGKPPKKIVKPPAKPIITNDPKDPRLKRYNDSLNLYNKTQSSFEKYTKWAKENNIKTNSLKDEQLFYQKIGKNRPSASSPYNQSKIKPVEEVTHRYMRSIPGKKGSFRHLPSGNLNDYLEPNPNKQIVDTRKANINSQSGLWKKQSEKIENNRKNIWKSNKTKKDFLNLKLVGVTPEQNSVFRYKKPVQPVIYKKVDAPKPTVKPVIKDTVVSKPVVAKAVVKPIAKSTVTPKPAQNIPKIKSSNNYGDTGTVSRGSYIETKTKMAPKKGPSTFKTVKKNYK